MDVEHQVVDSEAPGGVNGLGAAEARLPSQDPRGGETLGSAEG